MSEADSRPGDLAGRGRGRAAEMMRTFSSLTAGKIIGDLATFALFIVISRLFGQEGIGEYSFAIGLTGIFAVLSELGSTLFTIRELSHSTEPFATLFGRVLSLRLALVASAWLLLLTILPILPFPSETVTIVAVIGAYQLLYQLIAGFGGVLVALGRPATAGALEGLFRVAAGGSAIAVALITNSLLATLTTLLAVTVVTVLVGYVLVRVNFGAPRLVWRWSVLLRTARELIPYGLTGVLGNIQQRLDVTLLGLMVGTVAAGIYNVAYRAVFMLLFIPHFYSIAILPVASRLHAAGSTRLRQLYGRSVNLAVLIAVPASGGLTLVAPDVISLIFGADFSESVPLLRLLAWLLLLAFLRFVLGTFLTACGRQIDRTRAQGWTLPVAAILYAVLIPLFGVFGAAVAALSSEALLVALLSLYLWPRLGLPRPVSRLVVASAGTAAFIGLFTLLGEVPLVGVILGSAVLYLGVVLIFPRIRAEELPMALSLLRKTSEEKQTVEADGAQ